MLTQTWKHGCHMEAGMNKCSILANGGSGLKGLSNSFTVSLGNGDGLSFCADFHGVLHFQQKFQYILIQTSFDLLSNYVIHPKYFVDYGGGHHFLLQSPTRSSEPKVKIEKMWTEYIHMHTCARVCTHTHTHIYVAHTYTYI